MKTLTVLTFCTFAMFAGSALAQTADSQTPAEESVCDVLDGAAWGLCNAYCEAMDCDSANPNANRTACDKVKGKFAALDVGDLPCEPVLCPCGTADDFIGLFTSLPVGTDIVCETTGAYTPKVALAALPYGTTRFSALHDFQYPGDVRCSAFDAAGLPIVEIDGLTEEEYGACAVEVESAANQLGVECAP